MSIKNIVILISLLSAVYAQAQEKAFDIVAGMVYPIRSNQAGNVTSKPGLTFGLMFRKKNVKGDLWSAGAEYQLLRNTRKVLINNREETEVERFEMFHLRAAPLTWFVGQKKRGFIEAGVFFSYLLHEEAELTGNITNSTKFFQRSSFGPSLGIGVQLGESMRKSLIIGLRDDFGAVSFGKNPTGGKGIPLRFNNIVLYAGLGI